MPKGNPGHARPLEKCVDVRRIRDWVPEAERRRVDITAAWKIIKTHYCAALVGRGVCPVDCEKCREAVVSMFGLSDARKPEALLTWRAKDRSAAVIEKRIAAEKQNGFPAPESDHPLDALFPKRAADNLFLELEKDYQ